METKIDIFTNTTLGRKIPIDNIKEIEKYYNLIKNKPICSFCGNMNLNYYDYIDGAGYICSNCYV